MASTVKSTEILKSIAAFKREFLLVGLLSALLNLLMLTPTLYMLQVYDRVMVSQNELTLMAVSALALGAFGLMALAEWMRNRVLVGVGLRLDDRLGSRVLEAAFDASKPGLPAAAQRPARAFTDLLVVRQFITGNGVFAFFDLPWLPIYIAVMSMLHPWLGVLAAVFALIQALLAWWGHRGSLQPAEEAQRLQSAENLHLQGRLRSVEVLESMGMMGALKRRWEGLHADALGSAAAAQETVNRQTAISKFTRYTQQSLALGAGALLVIDGQITAGSMIAANVLISRALAPIDLLSGTWRGLITAREAYKRLQKLLSDFPVRQPPIKRAPAAADWSMRKVSVQAPGRAEPILRDVDVMFPAGQVTVLLGPSGCGKSTLVRALLGIWHGVDGMVTLDHEDIRSWDRAALGPTIGYLPQDVQLFEGTVAENIARFGEVDSKRVIAAAQEAGLHDILLRLPQGYDTPLGDGAGLLSGGLRQRVALARALYGEPTWLVLDEPNAHLDEAGETALASSIIRARQRGAGVILVSHRPAAVAVADRVVVLAGGAVRVQGSREEVLQALRSSSQGSAAAPSSQAEPQAPAGLSPSTTGSTSG
jgi:ATP-binding cassette subfamily C exporter for protease/lipase